MCTLHFEYEQKKQALMSCYRISKEIEEKEAKLYARIKIKVLLNVKYVFMIHPKKEKEPTRSHKKRTSRKTTTKKTHTHKKTRFYLNIWKLKAV